ncbi:MAG: 30S ribosomal protein S7 [Proteobacteria bacterium]|jgi:small subunit ribosomal protein S7|nr:30S ribosomal protein S7 [Pseudomonadota bacterium]
MPRRRVVAKREVLPDPKFGNVTLAKFMNHVMVSGKKSVAESIVYGALTIVQEKLSKDPIEAFDEALENIAPMVEVKARRVGGATYQVPVEVRPARRVALSMRWLVEYARNRGEKSMRQRLAGEIIDASQGKGNAVKKREDVHRMAEANKAFSHFRF